MEIKLSAYAKGRGINYRTAWRWYRDGLIPGRQLPTGTILVQDPDAIQPPSSAPATATTVAIYARVSASENKANLDTQADRVASYCAAKGWKVGAVVREIGSGLNDTRPKLLKLLADPTVSLIVVEHRDRLTRFGFHTAFSMF